MSAVQPPPRAPKPKAKEETGQEIAPKKKRSIHDELAELSVMTDAPPIHCTMTQMEAITAAKDYIKKAPKFMPGEHVFYREHKSTKEWHGFLTSPSNGRYNLTVAVPGRGFERRMSVSWYDHTLPGGKNQAAEECDPFSKYNGNGTFRRSPQGKAIELLFAVAEELDQSAQLALSAKVDKLTAELAQLREQIKR